MKTILFSLAALFVAATAFAGTFPDISISELKEKIDGESVTVIDVNGTESYKEGHIPTAIDFYAVKDDLASKLPADKGALVVAYCANEMCPAYARAAQAAKDLGYTNVAHLSAGIQGWKTANEPVEKAE